MENKGVRMIRPAVPVSFAKEGEQIKCTYKNMDFGFDVDECFDTV